MIRSKIKINGKTISVEKVEREYETVASLIDSQTWKSRKAFIPQKNKNEERLKGIVISMLALKKQFETELLKTKVHLNELRKMLGRT